MQPLRDQAAVLLSKAIRDRTSLAVMVDQPETAHELLGFVAQQAVGKTLKAVLLWHGVRP